MASLRNTRKRETLDLSLTKVSHYLLIPLSIFLMVGCGGGGSGETNNEPVVDENPLDGGKGVPDSGSENAPPEFGDTPVDPGVVADQPNPTPNGIVDIPGVFIDNGLLGKWSTIANNSEIIFTFNSDSSCSWGVTNFGSNTINGTCTWSMVLNDNSDKILLIEYLDSKWEAYQFEQVSATDFRMMGGDLGIDSWLFNKAEPNTIPDLTPGRWFVGVWSHSIRQGLVTFYDQFIEFKLDGSMVVETKTFYPVTLLSTRTGTWSVTADGTKLNYEVDPTPTMDGNFVVPVPISGSYTMSNVSYSSFDLPEVSQDTTSQSWSREIHYIYRPKAYVGHYQGSDTSITISEIDANSYNVDILFEGTKLSWVGYDNITQGRLVIPLPVEWQFLSSTTLELSEYFNGISLIKGTPTLMAYLANSLTKVSETKLASPTSLVGGTWHRKKDTIGEASKITLMPDGQYAKLYGNNWEYGTYQINGSDSSGQITIDPVCSAPYSYDFALVEDQWVTRYPSSVGGSDYFGVDHYEPVSQQMVDLVTLQYNASNAIANKYWEAKFPTQVPDNTFVLPNPYSITTPEGLVAVIPDLTPNDTIPGAQVFSTPQIYYWFMPSLWCLQAGAVTACDSGYFYFFPNGRAFYYSRTNWGISAIGGAPIGSGFSLWLPYSVEKNHISLGGNTKLDLLGGRRKLRFGEFCFDNLDWTSGTVK